MTEQPADSARPRRWCKYLVLLCCVAGLLAVLILAVPRLITWSQQRAFERTIDDFRKHPSQAGAEQLIELIVKEKVSRERRNELLRMLTEPEVMVRPSYAVGRPMCVSFRHPYRFDAHTFERTHEIVFDDYISGGSSGGGGLYDGPRFFSFGAKKTPGHYAGKIVTTIRLAKPAIKGPGISFKSGFPFVKYVPRVRSRGVGPEHPFVAEVTHTTPFDFNVVESGKAEKVTLVSNPALDAAMKAAVSAGTALRVIHYGNSVDVSCPTVSTGALPEGVCFRAFLQDAAGAEYELVQRLALMRGSAGSVRDDQIGSVIAGSFPTGTHTATLVLVSDPDSALCDPSVKTIWDGRIELPITFTVKVNMKTPPATP